MDVLFRLHEKKLYLSPFGFKIFRKSFDFEQRAAHQSFSKRTFEDFHLLIASQTKCRFIYKMPISMMVKQLPTYLSAPFSMTHFRSPCIQGYHLIKQVAVILSRWPNEYGNFSAHYKIVVDTDSGEIVSYSKWEFVFTDAGASLRRSKGLYSPGLSGTPS